MPSKSVTSVFTNGSRFLKNGSQYIDDTNNIKIWYNRPRLTPHFTDSIETIQAGEEWRPDLIANRVYSGRYELGWVIMLANQIEHVRELFVGKVLRIPSLTRVIGTIA